VNRRLLLTCLAAVAGAFIPASPTAVAAPSETKVVMISPVGDDGHLLPGYQVVKHQPGAKCTPHSTFTGNAYKCVTHYTWDPCWVSAQRAYVDCLRSPYSRKVTRLHVTRGYHNAGGLGAAKKLPWGLLLGNGARAIVIPGDFGDVQGKKINYSYNSFKTVLYGQPDKSQGLWRIRKARDNGRFHFKPDGWITINKAWFGAPSQLG
jgi:hypothetical protein